MKKPSQEISSPKLKNKGLESVITPPPDSSLNSAFRRLCRKMSHSPERLSSSSNSGDTEVMEHVFNYFDENNDGKISPAELQNCMKKVGGELSREEVEMAVQSSDSDDDGLLSLKDFTKLMRGTELSEEERKVELKEAFGMYAAEGTGCITPKSLKRMLSRLGESTTVRNCEAMIRKFDLNGDGFLSFEEFMNMMH